MSCLSERHLQARSDWDHCVRAGESMSWLCRHPGEMAVRVFAPHLPDDERRAWIRGWEEMRAGDDGWRDDTADRLAERLYADLEEWERG